jgi:hypothetical protein
MIQALLCRLRARSVALVAIALVAGCTQSRLLEQHANPAYVGKPFKRVLVVAVTQDNVGRRLFEDRMTALLGQRGIKGVQAYSILGGKPAAVEEAKLRAAIAEAGADGMLIARATRVEDASFTTPGRSVAIGVGWGGLYGYYSGIWQTSYLPPETVPGPARTISETRLFDARTGTLAWSGTIGTQDRRGVLDDAALQQYVEIVFDAMVRDGVI